MAESFLDRMSKSSHLAGTNAAYVEALYETYLSEPGAVPSEWQSFFNDLPTVAGAEAQPARRSPRVARVD